MIFSWVATLYAAFFVSLSVCPTFFLAPYVMCDVISQLQHGIEQAGTELGQAQLQLELGFILIKVCCITLMITNYHYIS